MLRVSFWSSLKLMLRSSDLLGVSNHSEHVKLTVFLPVMIKCAFVCFRDFPALLGMIHHNSLIFWDSLNDWSIYIYIHWLCLVLFTGICTSSQNPILDRWHHPQCWLRVEISWELEVVSAPDENGRDSYPALDQFGRISSALPFISLLETWRRLPMVLHSYWVIVLCPGCCSCCLNPCGLIGAVIFYDQRCDPTRTDYLLPVFIGYKLQVIHCTTLWVTRYQLYIQYILCT